MKTKYLFISVILYSVIVFLIGCGSSSVQTEGGKTELTNPVSEQVQSDLTGITITISYDTNYSHKDYYVEAGSTSPLNDKSGNDKFADKNLINFPCTGDAMRLYRIPSDRVSTIIKTKYDMSVYDRTDYVFTKDSLYIVNTTQKEFSNPKVSYVYVTPAMDNKLEYDLYFQKNSPMCADNMNKKLLYQVLEFCLKNNIKY